MRKSESKTSVVAMLCVLLGGAGCADEHASAAGASAATGSTQAGLAFLPDFPGAGKSGADAPLVGGMICDSVARVGTRLIKPMTRCFYQSGQTKPAATIEQVLECVEGTDAVHLRLTFDPAFVDNSYGANAIGWGSRGGPGAAPPPSMPMPAPPPAAAAGMRGMPAPPPPGMKAEPKPGPGKGGHTWKDLVGSDHAEFVVTNAGGKLIAQFKLDYISQSASAASGYASLGVLGGDGKMIAGDANDIVEWHTSIERNLNERGYADYVVDSPATDADYTPNAATPNWDYRVVYEVWIDNAAFGASGFGDATIEHVHASPSKAASDTIIVKPGECPCTRDGGCAQPPPPVCDAEGCTPPTKVCEADDPNCQAPF